MWGIDLDKNEERSFYIESMIAVMDIGAGSDHRLADPGLLELPFAGRRTDETQP